MIAKKLGFRVSLTSLSFLVTEHNAFLDDPGSLWLSHYAPGSDITVPVWNHMTNRVLSDGRSVTTTARSGCCAFAGLRC